MSDLAKNLRAYLSTQPAVTAHVGTRIFANAVPQDAEGPYVWYNRQGTTPVECLDAPSGELPLYESFEIECWCENQEQLFRAPDGMIEAMRNALANYRGPFGDTLVSHIELNDNSDDYEARGANADVFTGWFPGTFSIDIYENG